MGTCATSTRTYRSVHWAVLPGSAARGFVLGMLHVPLSAILFAYVDDSLDGTGFGSITGGIEATVGYGGIVAIGFVLPFFLSLLLAYLEYSRRRLELGADGVTERRGLLFREQRHFPYDDIEEVTITRSKMQSVYGAGTITLVDVDTGAEAGREMRFSFIENPGAVYTNILRNVADVTGGTAGELDPSEVSELSVDVDELSRMDEEDLAAGTGFKYLMPEAVLHPDPWRAAKYGGLVGLGYSAVGAILLRFLEPVLLWAIDLPTVWHLRGVVGLGALVFSALLCAWYYWRYDRKQYELYEDHIRLIEDGEKTSVSLGDVASLDQREGIVKSNDVGHIGLLDEDGDELLAFEFVTSPDDVFERLEAWVHSA